MRSQLQLILATVGLTVLIWVYADQQGYKTIKFPIAVTVTSLPDVVPRVEGAGSESPQTVHVTVIARGPNAAIRELNLGRPPVLEVTIPVTENITLGTPQVIDLRDPVLLALRDRGLQLLDIDPPSITVTFDRLVKIEVQLQVDAGLYQKSLAGGLQIEPPTVTATVLASKLAELPAPVEPRLRISIEEELRSQPVDTEFDFIVPLKNEKWHGLNVRWEPETVRIRGRLQRRYEDLALKLIPLRVLLPWNWPADRYEIVWVHEEDRVQKVDLKVPVGKTKLLTNTDVIAFISIDDTMLPPEENSLIEPPPSATATQPVAEPSPYSQTVRFVLPEGFEDVKIVSPPYTVRFRIVPRGEAEAAPP